MSTDELQLLMICSPSGAGKSTLTRHLLSAFEDLTFSVSHTTRAPREGETDGVDYHFVDRSAFDAEVEAGHFAEWAEVHGNRYGTSLRELERAKQAGKRALLFDVDVQGARQLRARLPGLAGVFILPPSFEELERRLVGRASDAPEVIERRLQRARAEIEHYPAFDYLLVNDDLEAAKATLEAIVRAERSRKERVSARAELLLSG